MPRLVAVVLALSLVLAIPATSSGWISTGDGGDATAAKKKKKKCKKGYVRKKVKNKKGKRVSKCVKKKKKKLSGVRPADGLYTGTGAAGQSITVFVSGKRTKVDGRFDVPQSKMQCSPSGQPARGGEQASVLGMKLSPDGSFSGSSQTGTGQGPSGIAGRFLSQTKVEMQGVVSGRQNGRVQGDLCGGTDKYTLTIKKGSGR